MRYTIESGTLQANLHVRVDTLQEALDWCLAQKLPSTYLITDTAPNRKWKYYAFALNKEANGFAWTILNW